MLWHLICSTEKKNSDSLQDVTLKTSHTHTKDAHILPIRKRTQENRLTI